jgi:hypothetical protein
MNNLSFLQMVAEKLKLTKDNPINIYSNDSKCIVLINGQSWDGGTLDQCVSSIKQSFAIKYLEER